MRRVCLTLLLLVLAVPVLAHAASWHAFHNKQFGFAFGYPANWKISVLDQPGNRQVAVISPSRPTYALDALVVAARPARSLRQTLQRFLTYERSLGNSQFAGVHWSHASLGGKPAMVGIIRPSTEGGVSLVNAILIAPWHGHIYEVTVSAYNKPAPSKFGQFPAIYSQILRTWRFL